MAFDVAGALGAGYSPDDIVAALKASDEPLKAQVAAAVQAGYSHAEVVDHLNPKTGMNRQGIPLAAPIQRGLAQGAFQVANLATDAGLTGVGSAIRSHIPQAALSAPSSGGALVEDLKAGRLGFPLSNLPSAALEQAAPLVATAEACIASEGSIPATLAAGAGIGALT